MLFLTNTVTNFSLQTFTKLNLIYQAVTSIKITVDFAPVLNAIANINTQITAIIQRISTLQIGSNNITSIVNNINNEVRKINEDNSIQEIKDLLEFEFDATIGDCIDVQAQSTGGSSAIVPGEREYSELAPITYNSFASTFIGIHEHLKAVHKDICEIKIQETDCMILMPDTKLYYDAGKFLIFSWVLESNPDVHAYQTHSQIRNPIPALQATPDPTTDYWGIYFESIYKILGTQYANYWATDSKQNPLLRGWFSSETEALRFFNQMQSLTTSIPKSTDNPRYRKVDNDAMNISNIGQKLILKRVCYAEKDADTDQLRKKHGWRNPNL